MFLDGTVTIGAFIYLKLLEERLPPSFILPVPSDSLAETLFERDSRHPTQFILDFCESNKIRRSWPGRSANEDIILRLPLVQT